MESWSGNRATPRWDFSQTLFLVKGVKIMRKNIKIAFKKLSLIIATSLVVSALSPLAAMAEEIPADLVGVEVASENLAEEAGLTSETEADYVTLDITEWDGIIVDGQATEENLLLPAESVKLASASVASTEGNDEDATSTTSTNFAYNASYIGKIEKKGVKFRVRVPYWFANAYPKAGFKVSKKSTTVMIPVYDSDGKKVTTKKLKLNTDSYLWLGNYDYDDYFVCPPWLKMAFDNSVVENISKNALSQDGIWYDRLTTYLPAYKNAKAKKKGEKPLATRKVEFYTSKKYRISNTTEAIANPGSDVSVGF